MKTFKPMIRLRKKNVPINELVQDLRIAAKSLSQNTITTAQYNLVGTYHASTLMRKFGSWPKALSLAGLRPSRSPIYIPTKALFENLTSVWSKLNRQPSYNDINNHRYSSISGGTYEKRFGSWNNALSEFSKYMSGKKISFLKKTKIKHSCRSIKPGLRLEIFKRDHYSCKICGASPAKDHSVNLVIDHIVPFSKGGSNALENLQTLCNLCNQGKADKD